MASSSSSSSTGGCEYDVFLNFRGADTRKIFVGHLHRVLAQKGLNAFIDSEDLRKGITLPALLKFITDSKISIVVFSENYASSTWCLKELAQIMKCKARQEQIVVPVFYQVDPSDIRKQKGTFEEAFAKHESNKDLQLQEVQSWRDALTEAANLSGWDSTKYEDDAKLIDDIVDHVFKEWFRISSSKNNHLVGMDSHLHKMRQLLRLEMDSRVLRFGIWGMGGIGKTTIAEAVFDEIRHQFDHYYFLRDVKGGKNQVCMQKELLSGIFKTQVQIHTLNDGYKMMERLSMKKVLVVLDDVDNPHQIETLLGPEPPFGGGSRIIVTTRDRHIPFGFEMYEVKLLSDPDAHKLFCQHAFKINKPSEEYDHLSRRAVKYAQGLPLALTVLGSFLHNRNIVSDWEFVLEKLKKTPYLELDIHKVLKTSFDGLDRTLKDIFLDIACFFRGMDKDYITKVLDSCGFSPDIGLKVLVERALLTISDSNKLEMHDLLQEMGREIESTKKPRKRSRFWSSKDVEGVLTGKKATEAVEGLMINDLSNSEIYFEAEAFVRMTNLRLLIFTGWNIYHHHVKIHVNGDLKRLSPELRVLIWHRCPLKSLPSNFHPKNLVYLDMRLSHLKRLWQGRKSLKKMISINLNYCQDLNKTPDLTEATNLEKLELEGCISLREVHSSIAGLTNLVFLSLRGCRELKSLPSSIHMKSLKFLNLHDCSNLEIFPEILEDMEALLELKLDGTAIKELPSSIERLRRLQSLSMKNCKSLVRLPDSICNLAELRFLNLCGCLKLCNLPENLGNLESLWELLVHGSGIIQLPVSILRLKLGRLSFYYCKQMEAPLSGWSSSIQGYFNFLGHINLSNCNRNPLELPDAIAHLPSLTALSLPRTKTITRDASQHKLLKSAWLHSFGKNFNTKAFLLYGSVFHIF